MISKDRKLLGIKIDIVDTRYKIDDNNLIRVLKPIYRKIAIKKNYLFK